MYKYSIDSVKSDNINEQCMKAAMIVETISTFNSLNAKKILGVKEMDLNKVYPIEGAHRSPTKYGECVRLELANKILYLPKRFNALTDEMLEILKEGNFTIEKKIVNDQTDNSHTKLELSRALNSELFFTDYM